MGTARLHECPVFWARKQNRDRMNADLKQIAAEAGHGFVMADLNAILDAPNH
jgi:3-hydroxyacyl-CoA dehydrogenase